MEFAFNRRTADDSYQRNKESFWMRTLIEWKPYAWISLGAIAGANLRYFLSRVIARVGDTSFPYGTLVINVTGSLILGFFIAWTTERVFADPMWRALVAIGFCGSYTTFSGFAYETMAYFEQGNWGLLMANVAANNLLCLAAVLVGMAVARAV